MSSSIIADNKPIKVTLQEGKNYFYCCCGRSAAQPFCDGSHKGTDITPRAFTVDKSYDAFLCNCKHSANKPFCDGTHKTFPNESVGKVAE
jgi:CDGSH-type Zn-finger protein